MGVRAGGPHPSPPRRAPPRAQEHPGDPPLPFQAGGQGEAEHGEQEELPHLCRLAAAPGSAAAPRRCSYTNITPWPRRAAITPLSESTPGSGSSNESLATAQARQSGRSGVKFALVGEGLVVEEQGSLRGRAGWSRTGSPSQHQPLTLCSHSAQLHWCNALGERSPFSLLCPWPCGCPTSQHRAPDWFVLEVCYPFPS